MEGLSDVVPDPQFGDSVLSGVCDRPRDRQRGDRGSVPVLMHVQVTDAILTITLPRHTADP